MNTLAQWHDGGPGPWVLLFPFLWAAAIAGAVFLLRRTVWRRGGPGRKGGPPHRGGGPAGGWTQRREDSPVGLLDRRFASGEIDEDEYWRRLSVLNESAHDGRDGT